MCCVLALEGANPSAEGEDADEGTDETKVTILDLADQFRLQKIEGGMSKKSYQSELKSTSHVPVARDDWTAPLTFS
jgi:hypothetical protein